jgi:8-hydroxy-5-deazaflavin:NADPH oxidoreductase
MLAAERRRGHDHHRNHRQRARGKQPGQGGYRPRGLYDEFGFDAVDIGGLGESWRIEAGQPAFVVRQDVAELTANVARATRGA